MGQALYRKYRSRALDELIGQEHITSALDQALRSGALSHAYLFSGPRGVGKTSAARILAYAVNKVDYGDNSIAMDIIEIDAASNNSVEDVRDLREKVFTAPAHAKYKVYIIDEAHMLSRAAFNALLKTLEEPPAHVIFILATTEAHKLPATILSRTQRFHFRLVETDKVIKHLKAIAKSDKIDIDDGALAIIASHGQGSFRDSISLLDQARSLKSSGQIKAEDILDLLGQASDESLSAIESALANHDASQLVERISASQDQGVDAALLAKQLAARWRRQLLAGSAVLPNRDILKLLADLIGVPDSKEPYARLEIILLDAALSPANIGQTESPSPNRPPNNSSPNIKQAKSLPKKISAADKIAGIKSVPTPANETKTASGPENALWPEILKAVKAGHNSLYGAARMARAEWQADKLSLYFRFPFHQKIVSQPASQQIFVEAARDLTGREITIECRLDVSAADPPPIATNGRLT
ncbi:MAG: DNA polymerase III subunit gamma/tau, partial [Candidatus Saccharimonadales bacterium]